MPKVETKSGTAKRFRKTAGGLKHRHAFKSHILTKMTIRCKCQLCGTSMLNESDVARVERSLCLRRLLR